MYEDIAGIRTHLTGVVGSLAAASTVEHSQTRVVMFKPFTLRSLAVMAGTAAQMPAGASMTVRVWVNGVRKGIGTITLVAGAGRAVSVGNGFGITGPADSVLGLSVAAGPAASGTNVRFQYRIHHGHIA